MTSLRRRIADTLGTLLGSYIITKQSAPFWPESFFTKQMFARLKPDCVFDVGANIGQYARALRSQGFTGTILSFEPNPSAYQRLVAASVGDAHWHCFQVALGREPGIAPFNVMQQDVFSSFRTPLTGAGVDFVEENSIVHTVDVDVKRLEDMMPALMVQYGFSNPFLKLDTQGFDLEVLVGAGAAIRQCCAILSEVSVRKIYADSPDIHESLHRFNDAGFKLAALYSVHANLPLKAIEFNCYLVRQDLAEADQPS